MLTWLKRLLGIEKQQERRTTSPARTIPIAVDADIYAANKRKKEAEAAYMQQLKQDMQQRMEAEAQARKEAFRQWKENCERVNALLDRQAAARQEKTAQERRSAFRVVA